MKRRRHGYKIFRQGFTLLEMSIVLAIIGLVTGGILVGANMLSSAGARAQIAQVDKFQSAAAAFETKYGFLPGDIPAGPAAQFGFAARGSYPGEGDGNGIIQGNPNNTSTGASGGSDIAGETAVFWVDLAQAKLIEGNFTLAAEASVSNWAAGNVVPPGSTAGCCPQNRLDYLFPQAKIVNNNWVYVWSSSAGINYFGLSSVGDVDYGGAIWSAGTITPAQAYDMDKKIDDGLPGSGIVTAQYITAGVPVWAAGYPYINNGNSGSMPVIPVGIAGSSATCVDNAGAANGSWRYSVEQNNGSNPTCALSFQFQN